MVADHILDFEMEQGGDVMDLTSEVGYLPGLTDDVNSFEAGPLRLTTNDRDTHLEAPFSGKDWAPTLVLEDTAPEGYVPSNFDWMT
jgi:hypothetical protein